MDKFAIFDQILDAVFVVKSTTEIAYANQVASDFCGLSQKRLIGKKNLSDLFSFQSYAFPFNQNSLGHSAPSPYLETNMTSLSDRGRSGRVQMAVSPWATDDTEPMWVFILHDVSLEEALHSKYRAELEAKEGYIRELEVARAELEKYSKNLEEIVEQRTQELSQANRSLQAIINSLGQGFLTFDKSGVCGPLFTKACLELLGSEPTGKEIESVLRIKDDKKSEFQMWLMSLFSEPLPFDDLKTLGPDWFNEMGERSIFLEYFAIRDQDQSISDVVVVSTDKTQEIEAQKNLEKEKSFVEMILKFVRGQSSFVRFLKSVPDIFLRLEEIGERVLENEKEVFRLLHTLEGEAGTFSLQQLRLESRLPQEILQNKEAGWLEKFNQAVKGVKNEYDRTVKMVEDLFGSVISGSSEYVQISFDEIESLAQRCSQLPGGEALAAEVCSLRYHQTVLSAFSHYDGLVQNVAEKMGKKVNPIQFDGADIKLDLRPFQSLFSSFVHLFRNIVDHGIEEPEERQFIGKPSEGLIVVKCEILDSIFKIEVIDDGRGINPSFIRKKLESKFPDEDFSKMSDYELNQQILRPHFSSRDEVGEFSGRGVGMDAVREEVDKIGGEMRVLSQEGKGTRFDFEIPIPDFKESFGLKRSA